jgi:tRNA modification GTPase
LINSQTTSQRLLALSQLEGSLSKTIQDWRQEIKLSLAYVIAYIDFGEDAKIDDVHHLVIPKVQYLIREISRHILDDRGDQIRDGYQITLVGSPNVGKSSLMNILSKKDVSIVSEIEGTTRDVVQVSMSLGGYSVIINDTAGLRQTVDPIEKEGIKRALSRARESRLVIMLAESESGFDQIDQFQGQNVVKVINKIDLKTCERQEGFYYISCKSNEGIDEFIAFIKEKVETTLSPENILITRARHRQCFEKCRHHLEMFLETKDSYDIASEHLREAGNWLGKVTGEIDLEEILDVVFKEFCIGK